MQRTEFVYKQLGGSEPLQATVWYNSDPSTVAKPIALYFHGGNFVLGNKDMFSSHYAAELLRLGFGAVVSPNYRLGPTISLINGPLNDAKDSYLWSQTELPKLIAEDANVQLDGKKIVTIGHSAGGTLALLMASLPQKPLAILPVFPATYLEDSFYHTPNPAFSHIPSFPQSVLDEVQTHIPPPSAAGPPTGPNGPDLANPRVAWLMDGIKKGTWLNALVPNNDYSQVDPSKLFNSAFPPTYFIHGEKDTLFDVRFSKKAAEELKSNGVGAEIVIVEGAPHGFDAMAKPGDEKFSIVTKGFEFLARFAV
ncbi:Alpha/Beta hydrolase protein [Aspergillus karnatakaensis]|uniref:alpha/beta hydrolase n=1 Tax=Aspergillus karnatakaensis TaxID=1810916 RepID=UPI003CCE2E9B